MRSDAVESFEFDEFLFHVGVPLVLPYKPRVFCFVNAGAGTDWQRVIAIADDGHCLAQHISSSDFWARHDIGYTSNWKHQQYVEHYPDGCYLQWVNNPRTNNALLAAYEKNQVLRSKNEGSA